MGSLKGVRGRVREGSELRSSSVKLISGGVSAQVKEVRVKGVRGRVRGGVRAEVNMGQGRHL